MTPVGRVQHEHHFSFVSSHIKKFKHAKVLEIAIGPARISAHINVPKSVCIGVDASRPMLKAAGGRLKAGKNSSWNLLLADAFHLPFRSDYFDGVYTFRFVRHLNREQRHILYSEIKQVLKNGGLFMFDAPTYGSVGKTAVIYDQHWSKDEIISEISSEGFAPIEIVGNLRYYWLQNWFSGLRHFKLDEIAVKLIRLIESSNIDKEGVILKPLEWMVSCQK